MSYGQRTEARERRAFETICDRLGIEWYRVEADVGMMGGLGAHEYMAPCDAGENEVALASGYAANLEVASAEPQPVELPHRWEDDPDRAGYSGAADYRTTVELEESSLREGRQLLLDFGPVPMVFHA